MGTASVNPSLSLAVYSTCGGNLGNYLYIGEIVLYTILVLVIVVDGLCSQSAVYAHITPVSIQSVLKSID